MFIFSSLYLKLSFQTYVVDLAVFFTLGHFQKLLYIYITLHLPTSISDLGIFLDLDIVMQTHVRWTVALCFAMRSQLFCTSSPQKIKPRYR